MDIMDTKEARALLPIDGRRWFLDTEGNGQKVGEVIELGIVETIDLVPTGVMHSWLIRPKQRIDWKASRVHGIHDRDLVDMPTMEQVADEILSVLGDVPIGGQAIHGDLDILTRSLPSWRPTSAIDTYGMAKSLLPDLESYKLSRMTEQLGLQDRIRASAGGRAHCALNDAMACAILVQEMRNRSGEKAFAHAFDQAESLERWDRMVEKRIRRADKARTQARQKQLRREAQIEIERNARINGSNRSRRREERRAYQEAEQKRAAQKGGPSSLGEDA